MEDKKIREKAISSQKLSEVLKDKMGNYFSINTKLENKSHESFLFVH